MTTVICTKNNQQITLVKEIANSGEGVVWTTNKPGFLAKIYHKPLPERIAKLEVMIANPPEDPNHHLSHVSFAFPQSLIKDAQGRSIGFLMPEIKGGEELINIYSPKQRKRKKLEVKWEFLHYTARNIASIMAAIHQKGYVIGDIKPQNILINNQALPSFIDTDSFQVRNPHNKQLYRCLVGTDGYTPPELIGKDFHLIEQTIEHDHFRLGVLIYQLLFSYHPFQLGKWTGVGDKPEPNELIKQGIWLESSHSLLAHNNLTIPLQIVHAKLQECFLKCFNEGHYKPSLRPTAKDWLNALDIAINNLAICGKINNHIYNRNYGFCYWCERYSKLNKDIFDLSDNLQKVSTSRNINSNLNSQKKVSNSGLNYPNQGTSNIRKNPAQPPLINIKKQSNSNITKSAFKIYIFVATVGLLSSLIGIIPPSNKNQFLDEIVKLTKNFYNPAVSYYNQGVSESENKHYEKAISLYTKAIEFDPEYTSAYFNRGYAYNELNNYNKALADYNKVIALDPQNSGAHNNRGNVYLDLKKYEQAIADYNKALKIDPQHPYAAENKQNAYSNWSLAFYNQGRSESKKGNYQKAISSYTRAIDLKPQDADAYNGRGNAYLDLNKYEQAIADYNKALEIDPQYEYAINNRKIAYSNWSLAFYNQGNSESKQGRYEKAISSYTRAIELNPQNADAYNNRGNVYFDLEKYQQGISDYSKALKIDPQHEYVYNNRNNAYYNWGLIYFNRGVNFYNQKKYAEAQKNLEQAANLFKQQKNKTILERTYQLLNKIP